MKDETVEEPEYLTTAQAIGGFVAGLVAGGAIKPGEETVVTAQEDGTLDVEFDLGHACRTFGLNPTDNVAEKVGMLQAALAALGVKVVRTWEPVVAQPPAYHRLCAHCDHFVEENERQADLVVADYVHLDDGEKDHDHDAEPAGPAWTKAAWQFVRPDLFLRHEDGKVGPNSGHHKHLKAGDPVMACRMADRMFRYLSEAGTFMPESVFDTIAGNVLGGPDRINQACDAARVVAEKYGRLGDD